MHSRSGGVHGQKFSSVQAQTKAQFSPRDMIDFDQFAGLVALPLAPLAAHGARSCLSVRTQPLTATGAPSQTSTIPYHWCATVDATTIPAIPKNVPPPTPPSHNYFLAEVTGIAKKSIGSQVYGQEIPANNVDVWRRNRRSHQ